MTDDDLAMSLHGPAVTIEDAIEAGEAMKDLLGAVGRAIGARGVEWQIASVQFQCDGCGLTRPNRPGPDEGWTYGDGNDYCPECTTGSPRAAGS